MKENEQSSHIGENESTTLVCVLHALFLGVAAWRRCSSTEPDVVAVQERDVNFYSGISTSTNSSSNLQQTHSLSGSAAARINNAGIIYRLGE